MLFSAPPYLFGTLFGNFGQYLVNGLDVYHRVYLYIAFIILIGLYLILRRRDREFIRMMLLFISIATLISFCYDYDLATYLYTYQTTGTGTKTAVSLTSDDTELYIVYPLGNTVVGLVVELYDYTTSQS